MSEKVARMRQKAKIYASQSKGMDGKELRRLRVAASLSERQLAAAMGWNRKKVERYQNVLRFEIHHTEMQKLLTVLSATPF